MHICNYNLYLNMVGIILPDVRDILRKHQNTLHQSDILNIIFYVKHTINFIDMSMQIFLRYTMMSLFVVFISAEAM